jgi:hypothetical protein
VRTCCRHRHLVTQTLNKPRLSNTARVYVDLSSNCDSVGLNDQRRPDSLSRTFLEINPSFTFSMQLPEPPLVSEHLSHLHPKPHIFLFTCLLSKSRLGGGGRGLLYVHILKLLNAFFRTIYVLFSDASSYHKL